MCFTKLYELLITLQTFSMVEAKKESVTMPPFKDKLNHTTAAQRHKKSKLSPRRNQLTLLINAD